MANVCEFDMRIAGKEEAIKELVSMFLREGGDNAHGLGRVFLFEPDALEPSGIPGIFTLYASGDCANSLRSSMCDDGIRYPSLESETERLGLVVEVFSKEPACEFSEHVLVVKGDLAINDCVHYEEHVVDSYVSVEKYNEIHETNFTADMVNCNGEIIIGGFGDGYMDWQDVSQYFVPADLLPEKFVFKDLSTNETEAFHLAAICENGDGFYLGDLGSLVRSTVDTPFFEPENEKDENGLVVFNEFALNGLYFEYEVDGGLSPEATEMLLAEATVIVDSAISDIAKKHLSIDAQIGNANSIKDKQSLDSKDALNNNIEL